MCRRPDLHRSRRDVKIGELFKLVIHARQFLLDMLRRILHLFLDPCDVQINAAVRRSAARLDLAIDASCNVIAGQQFRRTTGILITCHISPAFFFVVGRLILVVRRNVVEHEPFAFAIAEDPAFAANSLGHQDAPHARRPDHSGRVELNKFHIDQLGPRVICKGVAIAGSFPRIARNFERPSHAARSKHQCFAFENAKAPMFPLISQTTNNAVAVLEQGNDCDLHIDLDALMDAVVL